MVFVKEFNSPINPINIIIIIIIIIICPGGKIEKNEVAGHVARMGEGRGVHRVLVGETRGKEAIGETQT